MANKYDGLSRIIIQNVEGKSNIVSLEHCITRLRFVLKDETKANTDVLKDTDGIVTVIQAGGEEAQKAKGSLLDRFTDLVSGVFTPVIGLLGAAGILKGLLTLWASLDGGASASGAYAIWYAVSDGLFYFLPVLLGYGTAKKFKIHEGLGMALGFMLVYPSMVNLTSTAEVLGTIFAGTSFEMNYYNTFFGIPIIMPSGGYTSTVVPVIIAVAAAAWLYRRIDKVYPAYVRGFLTPVTIFVIVAPLTYLVIGPVSTILCNAIAVVFTTVYGLPVIGGLLCGLLLGGVYQILVIFGLHWGLMPLCMINYATLGYDMLLTPIFVPTFAQAGAVLASYMRSDRSEKNASLMIPAFFSAMFGISEPAIYGVTLPRKKPFVITCIVSAIGGAVTGFFGVSTFTLSGGSFFALPAFINTENGDMTGMFIMAACMAGGFVLSYLMTYAFCKDESGEGKQKEKALPEKQTQTDGRIISVFAPMEGEAVELSEVEDEVFSREVLGKGIAIKPVNGRVYAPADGVISTFFATGHAVGITTDSGAELLIHVGMDTVKLEGKGFYPKKKEGDRVKKGELLLEFDLEMITKEGFSTTTPIIVTNTDAYVDVVPALFGRVKPGDMLLKILR